MLNIWVILWLDIFFGFMHIIYMYALLFIHPQVLELSFVRKTMCHYYCILSLPGASPRSKHVKSVDWCLQLCNSGFEKFIQDRFMFAKYITLVLKDRDICLTTSTDWWLYVWSLLDLASIIYMMSCLLSIPLQFQFLFFKHVSWKHVSSGCYLAILTNCLKNDKGYICHCYHCVHTHITNKKRYNLKGKKTLV